MALLGDKVFIWVIKLKWGHWGGPYTNTSSVLLKKRQLGYKDRCIGRENALWTGRKRLQRLVYKKPRGLPLWLSVKNLATMQELQETWVLSLGWEDLLEVGLAIHSSILAWRIPWTAWQATYSPLGDIECRHNWSDFAHMLAQQKLRNTEDGQHTSRSWEAKGVWYFLSWSLTF